MKQTVGKGGWDFSGCLNKNTSVIASEAVRRSVAISQLWKATHKIRRLPQFANANFAMTVVFRGLPRLNFVNARNDGCRPTRSGSGCLKLNVYAFICFLAYGWCFVIGIGNLKCSVFDFFRYITVEITQIIFSCMRRNIALFKRVLH